MNYIVKFDRIWIFIQLLFYVFLIIIKHDLLLLINFFFTLVLAIKFCKNNFNGELLLSNFFVLFSLIFFLYGCSAALVEYIFFFRIPIDYYNATLLYAVCFPFLLLGSIKYKFANTKELYLKNLQTLNIRPTKYFIILFTLLSYKVWIFFKQGTLFNFSAYLSDRLELFKDISQLDIVVGLLLTGVFLYLIYTYPKLNKKNKVLLVFLILFYVFIQLSAGNRRDFIPIILGLIWVLSNIRGIKFNLIILTFFILGIISFNILAVFRTQSEASFDRAAVVENSFKYNEFVFPFETLRYEVDDYIKGKSSLRYGSTILINSTTIFIPREIFSSKPNSLASEFVESRFGGGMGYAYLPITEFFINFGFIGCLFCFYFLGRFFLFFYNYNNQRIIFLFYALIFDFCRGEISSLIYTFVFTGMFLVIIPLFVKGFFRQK